MREWPLALAARGIPYHAETQKITALYVPPLLAPMACHEILAFEGEAHAPIYVPHKQSSLNPVLLLVLALTLWQGLVFHWFSFIHMPSPPFPATLNDWLSLGFDSQKFLGEHQLWRAITALTLHSSDKHFLNNMLFTSIFSFFLFSRTGGGIGFLLIVAGGTMGNALSVFFRQGPILSVGFSTATFATIGLIAAYNCMDRLFLKAHHTVMQKTKKTKFTRSDVLPFLAGVLLLVYLGGATEEKTDFIAHLSGFCSGTVLGCLVFFPLMYLKAHYPKQSALVQGSALFIACFALVIAWQHALTFYQQ